MEAKRSPRRPPAPSASMLASISIRSFPWTSHGSFVNVPAFPPADSKVVVRINFDTLYSIAWLDLTKKPQIVSVPDTDGRFYLVPMLDMWTCFRVARLADDRNPSGQFPSDAARLERSGPRWINAHRRADSLRLDHQPHQDGRASRLRRGA
jgi:hypothetical protein